MVPANAVIATTSAPNMTDSGARGFRGKRPRLNLSSSKEMGNNVITINQASENLANHERKHEHDKTASAHSSDKTIKSPLAIA
jgi:hypothetical protein